MKTEYTQDHLTALARLYRDKEAEYRKLDAMAEEYLSAGNFVRRDNAREDAGNIWQMMKGIEAAAEALGIPKEVLRKAAKEGA